MQASTPPTLAELELVHENATRQIDECFKEHGDSVELRTMRGGLLCIEEAIKKLRAALHKKRQLKSRKFDFGSRK